MKVSLWASILVTSVPSLAKPGPSGEIRCLRLLLGGKGGRPLGQQRGVGRDCALLRGFRGEMLQVLVRA